MRRVPEPAALTAPTCWAPPSGPALLFAIALALGACERTGPCAAYDRTAEATKGDSAVRYCLSRNGLAQGPYTCRLVTGLGSVTGSFRDGKRTGVWTYRAGNGAVVRQETWVDDHRLGSEEFAVEILALPDDLKVIACDGHVILRVGG